MIHGQPAIHIVERFIFLYLALHTVLCPVPRSKACKCLWMVRNSIYDEQRRVSAANAHHPGLQLRSSSSLLALDSAAALVMTPSRLKAKLDIDEAKRWLSRGMKENENPAAANESDRLRETNPDISIRVRLPAPNSKHHGQFWREAIVP